MLSKKKKFVNRIAFVLQLQVTQCSQIDKEPKPPCGKSNNNQVAGDKGGEKEMNVMLHQKARAGVTK